MDDPTVGYAGVDWATDTHAVCVVDRRGEVIVEFDVANTAEGLDELCRRIGQAGASRVAIERPDGPVVDALLAAGLAVVVVASRSVKALRARYGSAGNKSDRADAYVLADCLRTDGHRWRSLEPDSPAIVTLRTHVRARKDLVQTRVAVANRLRAHLRVTFPGAVGLFRAIDSPISLRFLERFPSAARARWLSDKRLGAWLRANHYSGHKSHGKLRAHLAAAPAGTTGDDGDARAAITLAYVSVLKTLRTQIDELTSRLDELLDAHPDAHIFRSLPRAGTIRAATLLAEIGDCRARYPDPESLACQAGVAPSTRTSGRAPTPGPTTATGNSAPAANATPTPNASSPAAGPTSSGAAGKTTPPTTPPDTAPTNALPNAPLDIGRLAGSGFAELDAQHRRSSTPAARRSTDRIPSGEVAATSVIARYLIRISVDRHPGDPERSNVLYRENPLTWEELHLEARHDGKNPMTWSVRHDRDAFKELWLCFENEEGRFPLYPGERAWIEYAYTVSDEKWGTWFQRAVRLPTKRLVVRLVFPSQSEPMVWAWRRP